MDRSFYRLAVPAHTPTTKLTDIRKAFTTALGAELDPDEPWDHILSDVLWLDQEQALAGRARWAAGCIRGALQYPGGATPFSVVELPHSGVGTLCRYVPGLSLHVAACTDDHHPLIAAEALAHAFTLPDGSRDALERLIGIPWDTAPVTTYSLS